MLFNELILKKSRVLIRVLILILTLILFLFISLINIFSTTSGYSALEFNSLEIDSQITGRVNIETPTFLNPELIMNYNNQNINYSFSINSQGEFVIPSQFVQYQGVYKFYIIDENLNRFPSEEGFIYKYINNNYDEFEENIINLISNDSLDPQFAKPNNSSFNSEFILFHVSEILKQSYNYHYYNSSQSMIFIESLINASWSTDGSCSESNFNCSSRNYQPTHDFYSAAQIQGEVISALWKSYKFTQIEILKDYAINFSNSNPLNGDCNFINLSFNCSYPKGQSAMINGYIDAYLGSGNDTYLNRAINFGNIASYDSSIDMIYPLTRLFELTQNESYLNRAYTSYQLNNNICESSCNVEDFNFVVKSSSKLFIHYEEYSYEWYSIKRWGLNVLSNPNVVLDCSDASDSNSSICINSQLQYNLLNSFDLLKNNFFNSNTYFYDIETFFLNNGDLNISFKKHSYVDNATLYFRDSQELLEPFIEFHINSSSNNIILNNSLINASSFYEFYFQINDVIRQPTQINYIISNPTEFIQLEEKTEDIVISNPLFFCNPFDFNFSASCRFEYMQAQYISALSLYYSRIDDDLTIFNAIRNLTSTQIDPQGDDSTCDPFSDDFNCEAVNTAFITNPLGKPAVVRATSLIDGYVNSFRVTQNSTHLNYALKFANNPVWEECNFLSNNFNCGEEGVYKSIKAYSNLYSITGNDIYKNWVQDLITESNNFDNSSNKYLSWLYYFELLDTSQRDEILIFIENNSQLCLDFNCSIEEFYTFKNLIWKSYQFYQEEFIFDLGNNLLNARPLSPQNYCDPNAPSSVSDRNRCEFPNQQAQLINSYTYALVNYVNLKAPELNITILIQNSTLNFNDLMEVSCRIQNIGNEALENSSAVLLTEQTLMNGNLVNPIIYLDFNSTIEFNYTLNLTYGGRNELRCGVSNFLGTLNYNVSNLGEVTNLTLKNLYVSQVNNEFFINLTNFYDFPLENLILNFSNVNFSITNSTQEAQLGSLSSEISLPFLNSNSFELISLNLSFEDDMEQFSNISLVTEFEGFNNFNISILTLMNSLNSSYEYDSSFNLFQLSIIEVEIINDKLVSLENISVFLNSNYSNISQVIDIYNISSNFITIANFTVSNLSLINENNNSNSSILNNYSQKLNLTFIPLSNLSELELFFTSPTGLNFSETITISIDTNILEFNFTNTSGLLESPTRVFYEIINPTPFTFFNISLESLFNNQTLNMSNILPPFTSTYFNESIAISVSNSTQNISQNSFNNMIQFGNESIVLEVNNTSPYSFVDLFFEFENISQELYFYINSSSLTNTSTSFIIDNQRDITNEIISCGIGIFCRVNSNFLDLKTNFTLRIELEYESNDSTLELFNISSNSLYEIRNFSGSIINSTSVLIDSINASSSVIISKEITLLQSVNEVPVSINYQFSNLSFIGEDSFIFSRITPPSSNSGGGGGGGGSSTVDFELPILEDNSSNQENISDIDEGDDLILLRYFSYEPLYLISDFLIDNQTRNNNANENNSNIRDNTTVELFNYLNSKSILKLDENYLISLINTCIDVERYIFENKSQKNSLIVDVQISNSCEFKIQDIYIKENILNLYDEITFLENEFNVEHLKLVNMSFLYSKLIDANSQIYLRYELEKNHILQTRNIDIQNLNELEKNTLLDNILEEEFSNLYLITFDMSHLDFINNNYENRFSKLDNILLLISILISSLVLKYIFLIVFLILFILSSTYLGTMIIIKRDQIYIYLFKNYLEKKRDKFISNSNILSSNETRGIMNSINLRIVRIEQLISKKDLSQGEEEFNSLVVFYNKNYHFLNLNRSELKQASFIFTKMSELQVFFKNYSKNNSSKKISTPLRDTKQEINNYSKHNKIKSNPELNNSSQSSNSTVSTVPNSVPKENDEEDENKNLELDVFIQINKIKQLNKDLKLDEAEELIKRVKRRVDQISETKNFEKVYLLEKIEEVEKMTQHLLDSSYSYKISKSLNSIKDSVLEKLGKKE
ncbi:MAG: hypothetical protein LAT82_01300 [Nanoarchaeota archaeon]|nr:hypothetical protein [Nanoarchaeota archaeon]